uniref:Uncharacterized protein n=1 Tax=Tanacetum cinerariifolium TaxID=118510 RepID=A0A6L2K0V1_TANCI|nr:hypothetical protein [Tanacetum cinerariifolium]
MASLADKAILSGAENRPPMLEKDMYDSWRSRMEFYMLNRQHGRMILKSVEHGPLLLPSVTEDGVIRLKKYSELSSAEATQADCDVKSTNIILQALPLEIYALVMNDNSSTVNHSAYMASAPQIEYAPTAYNPSEFSSPETGLVVPVFQKGDDPIDAINHMMSFLTSVVASRYPPTNSQLRASSNPRVAGRGADDLDAYDSDCDELNSAKVALMANLSHHGSDTLAEVNNHAHRTNQLSSREMQVSSISEPSTILAQSNTKSTSDSNIISYYQYMNESQYNTVQNSTLPALQDDLILSVAEWFKDKNSTLPALQDDLIISVIEQLKTQVVNCTKKDKSRNIDRELALEKEVKELNNIVFKRNQSAQTIHMLTKPQVFYNHATRQALGFQNLCYLKKAQQLKPNMYDGSVIGISDVVVVPDPEDTLMHAEESRSKMIEKQNAPQMIEKKVITKPIDYAALNQLSTDFNTWFVPQTESYAEQGFWS